MYKAALKHALRGLMWVFIAVATTAFSFGGRAINEFTKTDRVPAVAEGIAIALLCGGVGALADAAANRLEEGDGPATLGGAIRK